MATAPSTLLVGLQTPLRGVVARVEHWLEAERDQLPLWLPVALGSGIAAWFVFPSQEFWIGTICAGLALAALGPVFGWPRRLGQATAYAGLMLALGGALVWARAEMVRHTVLIRPVVTQLSGTILRVEDRSAEGKIRLMIATEDTTLPARVRVSLDSETAPAHLVEGAKVRMRARLAPPATAAVPGGYDFSRAAWFVGLGAVGQALGAVEVERPDDARPSLRNRLSAHVRSRISGSEGGIAAAFASGDRGGIAPEDEEAMRASGLTHLLSISGLHVTAVVAAAMLLTLRLLALSPTLALRLPLMLISAGVGALAGIGYTLLTGAEVPTIRSCIAATLVLFGMALGREALTLRLVATGALFVLLLWPESLIGASFQLSFAAITAIVALHEWGPVRKFAARREEGVLMRWLRPLVALFATGIAVELALAPIALYHFHKSGLFGALANLVAIPLTTFVIMPLEACALLFDIVGLGAPFWWLTGQALSLLLWLAHWVASWPGAVAMLPSMPTAAFALMLAGGLWLLLWKTTIRVLGLLAIATGGLWAWALPPPDLLVTDDGRHLAMRGWDGNMALLRDRTGDFVRDVLAERAGAHAIESILDERKDARCTPEICVASLRRDGRVWMVGATRSHNLVQWSELVALCPRLDIIVSERTLPPACTPRWLKVDRPFLERNGGLAITFGTEPSIETSRTLGDNHPWVTQISR